jgi:hypothetical protein
MDFLKLSLWFWISLGIFEEDDEKWEEKDEVIIFFCRFCHWPNYLSIYPQMYQPSEPSVLKKCHKLFLKI